jgi:hypothetical protein
LIALNELKSDEATQLQVFGVDEFGQTLRTQNPDGSWIDGLTITSAHLTDFPMGMPVDDGLQIQQRIFTTVPATSLYVANHTFTSGEQVIFTYLSGTSLAPLVNGNTYFVGVNDSNDVSLYNTQSNALTASNPITLTTYSATSSYSLTDQRGVSVQTQFSTTSTTQIPSGSIVSFQGTT